MSNIPSTADVVIIGCSIAYHLTKLGITDVVLLKRRQLTCGTTWYAAGLVPQLRATRTLTELAKYTSELLKTLEAETGQVTGFKHNGSIAVALTEARFEEFKRNGAMGRAFGVEVDFLTPSEIKALYPLLDDKDVVGGLWTPNDGQTNPVDTTQAYAKAAKQRGARIFENTEVTDIVVENGRAVGVKLHHDGIDSALRAATVVPAAGMWSHWIGRKVGLRLPLQATEYFYIVTEPISGLPSNLPVLRVPEEWAYYKEDTGKLLIGAFEPVAKPWALHGGQAHGLKLASFHTMNGCRTEKSYRHWVYDISTEDLPAEAGLAFTCACDKPGGFIGGDIAIRQFGSDNRPNKRLLQLKLCDSNELLFHEEQGFVDVRVVGLISSGMFGHGIEASLGMGYVRLDEPVTTELLRHTRFDIRVGDRRVSAEARLGAWYDPANERIKNRHPFHPTIGDKNALFFSQNRAITSSYFHCEAHLYNGRIPADRDLRRRDRGPNRCCRRSGCNGAVARRPGGDRRRQPE